MTTMFPPLPGPFQANPHLASKQSAALRHLPRLRTPCLASPTSQKKQDPAQKSRAQRSNELRSPHIKSKENRIRWESPGSATSRASPAAPSNNELIEGPSALHQSTVNLFYLFSSNIVDLVDISHSGINEKAEEKAERLHFHSRTIRISSHAERGLDESPTSHFMGFGKPIVHFIFQSSIKAIPRKIQAS